MAATRLKRENVRIYQTDKLKFLKKASEDRGVRHDLSEAFFKKNALMQRILALVREWDRDQGEKRFKLLHLGLYASSKNSKR